MKKQTFDKKINLSKETISNLDYEDMQKFLGGGTYTCPDLNCPSKVMECQ